MRKVRLQRNGLQKVEQHADVAFEEAAIGMALVGLDGAFLAVNPAFCELVGRPEAELLGMTWQSITHPEDVEPGQQEVVNLIGDDARTFRLAKRYVRADGQLVWVLLSVSLLRNRLGDTECLFTQVVDITEQRRSEEELARLASIVEASDDAILSKDLNGTILSWNRGAERMYGYAASEIVGRSIFTIVPPDRVEEVQELLEGLRRGESVRNLETTRLCKDKSPIDVSMTISPIRDRSGAVVRGSTIARDITAQKRMARDLERTLRALKSALDEAQASEARSKAFLSDAAHHLRNPVAGIRACTEALLRGPDPTRREALLSQIARETLRLSRLVDRLLRTARLDQGEALVFERQDVIELCRDEVDRTRSLAPHLAIGVTGDEFLSIEVDPGAVREILGNLFENARRHAVSSIHLCAVESDGYVVLEMSDDGPGLPHQAAPDAFEAFVSLDGHGGSGLGLTVSRALARAHGGDLSYENGTFVVRLRGGRRRIFNSSRMES
ncbi:MAG: PAS domain S-box protein [Actinomycetota bacterium]|nr:PAS domain S-box protein [Actinomycetota bacterium]